MTTWEHLVANSTLAEAEGDAFDHLTNPSGEGGGTTIYSQWDGVKEVVIFDGIEELILFDMIESVDGDILDDFTDNDAIITSNEDVITDSTC